MVVRHILLAIINSLDRRSCLNRYSFLVLRLDLIVLWSWRWCLILRVAKKIHRWDPLWHLLSVVQIRLDNVLALHFCRWLPPLVLIAERIVVIQAVLLHLWVQVDLVGYLQSSVVRDHLHGVLQLAHLVLWRRPLLFIIAIIIFAAASIAAPPAAGLISIVGLVQRI